MLALVGGAWIGVVATLNGEVQSFLPVWVRARGLSVYQMVLFGSLAAGSLMSGLVATWAGAAATSAVAGVLVLLVAASQLGWPLLTAAEMGRPTVPTPFAQARTANVEPDGTTLVLVRYGLDTGNRPAFVEQMRVVEHSRRRTGARTWGLYQDVGIADEVVEVFTVGSWREHLQQHASRPTQFDDETVHTASALAAAVEVQHLVLIDRSQFANNPKSGHQARQQSKK